MTDVNFVNKKLNFFEKWKNL